MNGIDDYILMNISRKSLHFEGKNSIREVDLTNQTSGTLIYKIRTNKLDHFLIRPGRGLVLPGQTVTVQVGINALFEGQYRMQIAYCETDGSSQDDFTQLWSTLNKEDITNQLLNLSCHKEQHRMKSTDSPIIDPIEDRDGAKSQSSSMSLDPLKLEPLKKSKTLGHHNSNSMFQTVVEEGQLMQSAVSPLQWESRATLKELTREKEANRQLREKLRQKSEQVESLRYRVLQPRINRSFHSQHSSQGCFTVFNAFIVIFLCLLLGFCIGKASG